MWSIYGLSLLASLFIFQIRFVRETITRKLKWSIYREGPDISKKKNRKMKRNDQRERKKRTTDVVSGLIRSTDHNSLFQFKFKSFVNMQLDIGMKQSFYISSYCKFHWIFEVYLETFQWIICNVVDRFIFLYLWWHQITSFVIWFYWKRIG